MINILHEQKRVKFGEIPIGSYFIYANTEKITTVYRKIEFNDFSVLNAIAVNTDLLNLSEKNPLTYLKWFREDVQVVLVNVHEVEITLSVK